MTGEWGKRLADAGLATAVLLVVGMMIVPLPTPLLDVLIAANIGAAVLMLLVAIYMASGLELTAFPTLLLISTLYRLALNVSSTRLILLQADAGEVIAAFGDFVVRGNYVVGGVVFAILTLIQFLVIAKGSERVAEVGARFTLDAMPGKQMSIDAELRSGGLTQEEARAKRRELQRESQFYGAMDGAMKFVKGDAIASIVITVVNLLGGAVIGVLFHDLGVGASLRTFGLLTIGDGLVSQIPALLISTSAGLVVTRVASEEGGATLGHDVARQIFGDPRALGLGAAFLAVLAVVPGLPAMPFLALASALALAAALGAGLLRRGAAPAPRPAESAPPAGEVPGRVPLLVPVGVEVGSALGAALGGTGPGAPWLGAPTARVRDRLFLELGLPLPAVRLRESAALEPWAYAVSVQEVPVERGAVPAGDAGGASDAVAAALDRVARRRARDLVGLEEVQTMLSQLEKAYPALVRHVVPKPVGLTLLTDVLRRLVEEGVSVRPLREILETLALHAPNERDPVTLTELCRSALRHQITYRHARDGVLPAVMLDPELEETVRGAIQHTASGSYLALAPDLARDLIGCIRTSCPPHPTPLLTQADVRRFVRRLVEVELPELVVLSYQELAPEVVVQPVGHARM